MQNLQLIKEAVNTACCTFYYDCIRDRLVDCAVCPHCNKQSSPGKLKADESVRRAVQTFKQRKGLKPIQSQCPTSTKAAKMPFIKPANSCNVNIARSTSNGTEPVTKYKLLLDGLTYVK